MRDAISKALLDALAIIALVFLADMLAFYAMPNHMEFDNGACPDYSLGCTFTVMELNSGIVMRNAYVKYPLFSVEIHEFMHTQGYADELIPSVVSTGITLLLFIPVMMIYFLPETVSCMDAIRTRVIPGGLEDRDYLSPYHHPQAQSGNSELHKQGRNEQEEGVPTAHLHNPLFSGPGGKANND